MELTFIFALLAIATALVFIDLALLARQSWHKEQVRRLFRARIRRDLERDSLIHDRSPEEAMDYLDVHGMREAWYSRGFDPTKL